MSEIFLDEDLAYLFGLITGRGKIIEQSGFKQVIIEFPYRSLCANFGDKNFNQKDKISLSLDPIVSRLNELTSGNWRKDISENTINLVFENIKNDIFWRMLKKFTGNKYSYEEFEIGNMIFNSNEIIKKEFLRGFADVCGYARKGNVYIDGRHRIYFEISNKNWELPVQLCKLLQSLPISIPVQTIDWGHPNTRNGNLKDYNKGHKSIWSREHQVKVFAGYLKKIGFIIEHKNEILINMANYNENKFPDRKPKLCNPCDKKRKKGKLPHPEEISEKLPSVLKGKHFNAYWEICLELGCDQGEN